MGGMGIAVSGSATFSRLDFPRRDPVVAVLSARDWGLETDLQIFNAHLVNPISRPIAQAKRLRAKELAALEQIFGTPHDAASRILVGDLNSSPAWPLYRRLGRLATDAAVATGTARRSWGPWPGFPRLLRIDHAFVQGPKPLRTTLVSISGTDHSGLLLDVEAVR
jgi:endonuclease/exonuclease/phosphatase family metal-dependent hydrolase